MMDERSGQWIPVRIASAENALPFHPKMFFSYWKGVEGNIIRARHVQIRLSDIGFDCGGEHCWLIHPDDAKKFKITACLACEHMIEAD